MQKCNKSGAGIKARAHKKTSPFPTARARELVGHDTGLSETERTALVTCVEELMNKGWTDSTKASYSSAIRNAKLPDDALPMNSVAKILQVFSKLRGGPFHKVLTLRSAIGAFHRIKLWPIPPFGDASLSLFWEGLKRSCEHEVKGTLPLHKQQMVHMLAHWNQLGSPVGWRNAAIMILQFYLFRRVSEVLSASRNELCDEGVGVGFRLLIPRAKNDKYGRGLRLFLPDVTEDKVPLGRMLRAYMECTKGIKFGPLFRAARGNSAWDSQSPLFTADAWNTTLKDTSRALFPDLDTARISSHSLRKGGFTRSQVAGIPQDCAVDVMGHKSLKSWLSYSRRSNEEHRQQLKKL